MNKVVEVRVSVSTDPRVAHIGRYFVDVRDVTNGANRQLTTRVTNDPTGFVAELTTAALAQGVTVKSVDNTGE